MISFFTPPLPDDRLATASLVAAYLILHLIIFLISDSTCLEFDSNCIIEEGIPDAYSIAQNLINFGSFADNNSVSISSTPAYGVLIAITLWLGATNFLTLYVIQVVLVLTSAILVKQLVDQLVPRWGFVASLLLLFNPSLLATSHLPHEEILALFFLTLLTFSISRFQRDASIAWAIAVGFCVALTTLARADFQFLILLVPLLLCFINPKENESSPLPKKLLSGMVTFLTAIVLVFPWAHHQDTHGNGLSLASYDREWLFFIDNLRFVTAEKPGEVNENWKRQWTTEQNIRLVHRHKDWNYKTNEQQWELKLRDIRKYFLTFPYSLETFVIAAAKSTIRFFVSGGSGPIHSIFDLHHQADNRPILYFALKSIGLSYSVLTRILCILGLFAFIYVWGRSSILIFTCLAIVGYAWVFHGFQGKPRFRIPVEPQLAILGAYGLFFGRQLMRQLRMQRNP